MEDELDNVVQPYVTDLRPTKGGDARLGLTLMMNLSTIKTS